MTYQIEETKHFTKEDLETRPFDPANYLNNQNDMQEFLTLAIRNRKRNKRALCEAFKVVVRAGALNNPEKKSI